MKAIGYGQNVEDLRARHNATAVMETIRYCRTGKNPTVWRKLWGI